MLENLDDVIRRLSSFFLIPLVNVGLITLIVYFCSKGSVSMLVLIPDINVGGIAQYVLNFVKLILGGELPSHDELTKMFPGIATLTAIFATMSWLIGVFMIFTFFLITYLIDRTLYIIGWLVPFDFKFDFDLYGRAHSTDRDVATLYQLTKSTQAFDRLYRIAAEVLSQKSSNIEDKWRENTFVGIEFAETGFTYAKAYVLLLFVLGVLSLWFNIELWKVIVLLVIAAIVGLSCMIRYSHLYQRLVKHDVRRFISMEMYRKDPEDGTIKLIEPAAVGTGDVALPSAPPAEKLWFVGRFLARLLLRFEDSGILYATKVVYFGVRG